MVVDSLPFRTVAGFGIFEGGWLYLLGIWGYSGSEIFIKLLTFHILILITTTIWGVFSWIYLRSKEKTHIDSHIIP